MEFWKQTKNTFIILWDMYEYLLKENVTNIIINLS